MREDTVSPSAVNKENPKLCVSPAGLPYVETVRGPVQVHNSAFGAWYVRTHWTEMTATPEGAAWFQQNDPLKPINIRYLDKTLWEPHQPLALARMRMSNCCLWLDMGLGKTVIAIAYCLWRYENNLGNHFLIVCPPSVFVTWQDLVAETIKPEAKATYTELHGANRKKKLAELRVNRAAAPTFVITSYETLESVREGLQDLPICAIFFDESGSKLKNFKSARTQSAHMLCRSAPRAFKCCLSGTPSTTNPTGFYSQYELLGIGASGYPSLAAFEKHFTLQKLFMSIRLPHGKIFGVAADKSDNWLRFNKPPGRDQTYAQLGYVFSERNISAPHIRILNYHKRTIGFQNENELHTITQRNAYSVKKKDVLHSLPPKIYEKRTVELSAEQKKAYRELVETARTEIENTVFSYNNTGGVHAKLHQIANGYILDQNKQPIFFKEQPKLDELETILEQSGDEKIVLWSPFLAQIHQLGIFLAKKEVSFAKLFGALDIEQRKEVVHAFTDLAGPRVLIANPSVGGLGLNLVCSCLEVFVTNWFQPDVRSQAEDRLHRGGQTRGVVVVDLVSQGTLEVALLRNTLRKIELENKVIAMTDILGA